MKKRRFTHYNTTEASIACGLCGAAGLRVGWNRDDLVFYCPTCDYNEHVYGWDVKVLLTQLPLNWEHVYADHIHEGHVG